MLWNQGNHFEVQEQQIRPVQAVVMGRAVSSWNREWKRLSGVSCSFTWKEVWRHRNQAGELHNHLITEGSQLTSHVSAFAQILSSQRAQLAAVWWKQEWLLEEHSWHCSVCQVLPLPFLSRNYQRARSDCHLLSGRSEISALPSILLIGLISL